MGDFVVVKREQENFTKKRNIFVILMILILVNILHVFNEILHIQKKITKSSLYGKIPPSFTNIGQAKV